jgi:hypothetical protein
MLGVSTVNVGNQSSRNLHDLAPPGRRSQTLRIVRSDTQAASTSHGREGIFGSHRIASRAQPRKGCHPRAQRLPRLHISNSA